jgi:hypothetical protein
VYKDQRVNLQIIEKYRIPAVMKVKTDIITSNTGYIPNFVDLEINIKPRNLKFDKFCHHRLIMMWHIEFMLEWISFSNITLKSKPEM